MAHKTIELLFANNAGDYMHSQQVYSHNRATRVVAQKGYHVDWIEYPAIDEELWYCYPNGYDTYGVTGEPVN